MTRSDIAGAAGFALLAAAILIPLDALAGPGAALLLGAIVTRPNRSRP